MGMGLEAAVIAPWIAELTAASVAPAAAAGAGTAGVAAGTATQALGNSVMASMMGAGAEAGMAATPEILSGALSNVGQIGFGAAPQVGFGAVPPAQFGAGGGSLFSSTALPYAAESPMAKVLGRAGKNLADLPPQLQAQLMGSALQPGQGPPPPAPMPPAPPQQAQAGPPGPNYRQAPPPPLMGGGLLDPELLRQLRGY